MISGVLKIDGVIIGDPSISPYDPCLVYFEGQQCIHDNTVYQCCKDGVSGDWNPKYWGQIPEMTLSRIPHM